MSTLHLVCYPSQLSLLQIDKIAASSNDNDAVVLIDQSIACYEAAAELFSNCYVLNSDLQRLSYFQAEISKNEKIKPIEHADLAHLITEYPRSITWKSD